jgi:RNA polymerase sigma-70 factor, ECF subfamily
MYAVESERIVFAHHGFRFAERLSVVRGHTVLRTWRCPRGSHSSVRQNGVEVERDAGKMERSRSHEHGVETTQRGAASKPDPTPSERSLEALRYETLATRGSYGDAQAAAELLRSYLPLIRSLVALNVPAVDLEDVLQDCLVAVLLSLTNLRDAKAYKSWLIGVTLKVIAKYHRSQRVRRQWVVHGVEVDNSPASDCSPEQRVEITRLGVLLGAMEPELREVLLSRQADGLPMREVARDAGISLATVKRRLTRAREALEALRDSPGSLHVREPPELGSSST